MRVVAAKKHKARTGPRSTAPGRAASTPHDAVIELSLSDFPGPVRSAAPPSLAAALQRRQFTRAPYVTLARLHADRAASGAIARIDDLSEGGVRVRVDLEVPAGSAVVLVFALPITGETCSVRGVVRWAGPNGPHHALGISFEDLDAQTRHILVRYVTVMSSFGP